MSKIGVDVDDTLYSFTKLARGILAAEAAKTGNKALEQAAYASWPEWRTPVDLLGVDQWLEIIALCHDEEMIRNQKPYEGARELLSELAETHELVYVSSRNTERYIATKEWLIAHTFPQGELVCSGQDKNQHLRDCQYLIDDRPKNLIEFVYNSGWLENHTEEEARIGFGLMTEYNRALTDAPRIYLAPPDNWNLMRYYFVKTGILKEKVLV